jgi:hypothetical protein
MCLSQHFPGIGQHPLLLASSRPLVSHTTVQYNAIGTHPRLLPCHVRKLLVLPLVSAILMSHYFKAELHTYYSTSSLREDPILRAKARCKPCFPAAYKMSVKRVLTAGMCYGT